MEKDYFKFNPISDKTPQSSVKVGKTTKYNVKIAGIISIDYISFVFTSDQTKECVKVPLTKQRYHDGYYDYSVEIKFEKEGIYWYHFEVSVNNEVFYLEKTPTFDCKNTYVLHNQYMQLVTKDQGLANLDYQGGVMYHIFVDRFCKQGKVTPKQGTVLREDWGGEVNAYIGCPTVLNNEFFGGNLKGIIKKLDYLKSLNVSSIYLSPIFESFSNHKYDTADYSNIDSMFGSKEDLQTLIDTAKQKGIGIILDGVFNHTGSNSVYFNKDNTFDSVGAYQSKDSPYYKWYNFTNYPDKYDCWWGVTIMPQIDENQPSFIEFITGDKGIVPSYMKMGLLGFRLDVVDELSEWFLDNLCKGIKKVKKDALIIGEVWEDASNKIAYSKRRKYFLGDELDSVMNYPLKNAIIDYVKFGNTQNLLSTIYMIQDHYPVYVQNNLMNILGTHDTARILTVLGLDSVENSSGYGKHNRLLTTNQYNKAIGLLKQASLLQYTLMGVPCIYYGDEAGVQGIGDPYNRACYPWDNQDKELLSWYKSLGELRNNPIFKQGKTNLLYCEDGVIVFERVDKDSKIIVAINKNQQDFTINLTAPYTDFFTNKTVTQVVLKKDNFTVLIQK